MGNGHAPQQGHVNGPPPRTAVGFRATTVLILPSSATRPRLPDSVPSTASRSVTLTFLPGAEARPPCHFSRGCCACLWQPWLDKGVPWGVQPPTPGPTCVPRRARATAAPSPPADGLCRLLRRWPPSRLTLPRHEESEDTGRSLVIILWTPSVPAGARLGTGTCNLAEPELWGQKHTCPGGSRQ